MAYRKNAAEYKKAQLEAMKTISEINRDMKREFDRGLMTATASIMWMMHNEYGFGKHRLFKMMQEVVRYNTQFIAPAYDEKRKDGAFEGITLEDICKALAEECDIYIDVNKGMMYGSRKEWELNK